MVAAVLTARLSWAVSELAGWRRGGRAGRMGHRRGKCWGRARLKVQTGQKGSRVGREGWRREERKWARLEGGVGHK